MTLKHVAALGGGDVAQTFSRKYVHNDGRGLLIRRHVVHGELCVSYPYLSAQKDQAVGFLLSFDFVFWD